jgi:hypothetical protein
MFTTHNGFGGHDAHAERQPTKTARLTAVLGALLVASLSVNALTILADGNLHQRSPAAAGCEADHLACIDNPARQSAPQPARGATAPAHFRF